MVFRDLLVKFGSNFNFLYDILLNSRALKRSSIKLLLLYTLSGCTDAFYIYIISSILSKATNSSNGSSVLATFFILVAYYSAYFVLQRLASKTNAHTAALYRQEFLNIFEHSSLSSRTKVDSSTIINLLTTSYALFHNNFLTSIGLLFQSFTTLIVLSAGIILTFGADIFLLVSCFICLVLIVIVVLQRKTKRIGAEIVQNTSNSFKYIGYYLRLRELLPFLPTPNKQIISQINSYDYSTRSSIASLLLVQSQTKSSLDFLIIVAVLLSSLVSDFSSYTFLGMGFYALKAMPAIQMFINSATKIIGTIPLINEYKSFTYTLKPSYQSSSSLSIPPSGLTIKLSLKPTVYAESTLESISYNAQENLLEFSPTFLNEKLRLSLKGPSGVGKSLLLKSLIGLNSDNKMFINESNCVTPTYIDSIYASSEISYLPQDPQLLYGSWLYNITLSKSEFSLDKLLNVLSITRLVSDQILANHESLISYLSSRKVTAEGARVSGGERQRILLSQALYRNTKLLVIDEGLSALPTSLSTQITRDLYFSSIRQIIYISHNDLDSSVWSGSLTLSPVSSL